MQKTNLKAAPGVKFMEYDEYGLPNTEEAKELRKFISTEEAAADAIIIEAPPEQMEKALRPTGVRYDYDKPVDQMNAEGKYFIKRQSFLRESYA
jgi:hypothetical protein